MQIIRSEQIRQVPPKNALYYQQLKHQVFEMQLKKYSDNDPLLLKLLNPSHQHHTRQLIPPNVKRSFISKSPQEKTNIQQRAKSCSCAAYGYYCKKYKRLMDKGELRIQHHKRMVIRRFRKFVHAILLVQTYFRYHPQRKLKKMKLRRMSQLRLRGSDKQININILNKVSINESNATEDKQISKLQTIHTEKNLASKRLLRHQSDNYNKRPIWQFIINSNLHNSFIQRSARICRTEQSQPSPNKIINTFCLKNPYRSKHTSVLIRKYTKN